MQPKRPRVRSCHPSSHFPFPPPLPLNLVPHPRLLYIHVHSLPSVLARRHWNSPTSTPPFTLQCRRTNPTKSSSIPLAPSLFRPRLPAPPSTPSSKRNYVSPKQIRFHETLLRSTTLKNIRRHIVMDDASYVYLGVFLRPALPGVRLPRTLSWCTKRQVYTLLRLPYV